MPSSKGIVVFSGGTAANSLVDVFETVRENKGCPLSYIVPISDNGGSSSELIRVFGGPSIGDLRGRLVRLIPQDPPSRERDAISLLFNHRLSSNSSTEAAAEWQDIVSGTSQLWRAIPSAQKELIRSFLNLLNLEVLKRSRPPSSTFDFTSASVGNLFLTGARIFSGSVESAVYLLSSICGIPDNIHVIPSINSNFSHHISAGLANGDVIVGQNNISHPTIPTPLEKNAQPSHGLYGRGTRGSVDYTDFDIEDANLPGSLSSLRQRNIKFSKEHDGDLPARIERIWYINPYGQEMQIPANPRALSAIRQAQAIIFSIGSLYTSIVPSMVLRGIGEALRDTSARHKILILNGSLDREVGPSSEPYNAFDFIEAITKAGEQSRGINWRRQLHGSRSEENVGSSLSTSPSQRRNSSLTASRRPQLKVPGGTKDSIYRQYVTHIIYLTGEGTPHVDRAHLESLGIGCLKLYGRKGAKGMLYDPQALIGGIEAILGRKGDAMADSKSRRNTLDSYVASN